jgi:branched-chain amino acid transport system ATP-binding protein
VTALLEVSDVRKSFGGLQALSGCSFAVERGSVTGLIGPNGSGKTTMFNVLTGYERADSGVVRFDGRDITGLAAGRVARWASAAPSSSAGSSAG